MRLTGRAPPNRSRTAFDGSRTCNWPDFAALCLPSLLHPINLSCKLFGCTMRVFRGNLALCRLNLKKNYLPNPRSNVLPWHFLLTLFWVSFCPKFDFLSVLTPFFLQVDHLMDSGKATRVIAGILKNFENFLIFLQNCHDLGFKNRVFKSKVNMSCIWWKYQWNIFTNLPLACWALMDFWLMTLQWHLTETLDLRLWTPRQNKTSVTQAH